MQDYSSILYEVRDNVAKISLNRPKAANSLNNTLSSEFLDAVIRSEENSDVRALIITGTGRFFCAGADLKGFYSPSSELKTRVSLFHVAIGRIMRARLPVIAAVNGAAAGAGMGLACACDLVVVAESAKFTMAYSKIGLSPDGTTTYFLPRLVGVRRAIELAYLNRALSGREAVEWGIATRVVPDRELETEVQTLAMQLAAGPTRAYATAKRLMHSGWLTPLETQVDSELRNISEMAGTEDAREAIAAFAAKRAPVFRGR
jgi:2-(1,2-epoxy-1,2-dihydrophenyl)acetyl-CoA isomerase